MKELNDMKELNLYQKLAKARNSIWVKKTWKNSYAKYNYYELNEIYTQAKKVFDEVWLATFFNLVSENPQKSIEITDTFEPQLTKEWEVIKDEKWKIVFTQTTSTKKSWTYEHYKATLKIINTDKPDEVEVMEMTTQINNMKWAQPTQNTGATNTYMLKYMMMNLLMIDDSELDPDTTNTHWKEEVKKAPAKPTAKKTTKKADTKATIKEETESKEVVDKEYRELTLEYMTAVAWITDKAEFKKATKTFFVSKDMDRDTTNYFKDLFKSEIEKL